MQSCETATAPKQIAVRILSPDAQAKPILMGLNEDGEIEGYQKRNMRNTLTMPKNVYLAGYAMAVGQQAGMAHAINQHGKSAEHAASLIAKQCNRVQETSAENAVLPMSQTGHVPRIIARQSTASRER